MTISLQRLRPQSLGDIFDEAFDLYKRNFLYLLLVTAVGAVPLKILVGIVTVRFVHDFVGLAGAFGGAGSGPDLSRLFSWLGALAGGAAVVLPLYLIGYALQMTALAAATSACYLGEPGTVWGAYRTNLRRFLPLLLTALLYGLFVAIGWIGIFLWFLLLVPLALPFYIATRLLFTAHAFTVEGRSYGSALGRSNALVAGHGWTVFGCLILLALLSYTLILGIQLPLAYAFDILFQITPGAAHWWGGGGGAPAGLSLREQIVSQTAGGLAELLVVPYLLSVVTVLYYDLRIRKEAFDVELAARDLGYGAAPLPAEGGAYPAALPPLAGMAPPPRAGGRPG